MIRCFNEATGGKRMYLIKVAFVAFILLIDIINAEQVYDYGEYWTTFNNRIFDDKYRYEFDVDFKNNGEPIKEWLGHNGAPISTWNGIFQGKEHNVTIDGEYGVIIFNDREINATTTIGFEKKLSNSSEGMYGNFVYLAKNYICIEEYDPSISGSGAKVHFIFLIDNRRLYEGKNQVAYMLPPLFQSCLSIRKNNDRIYFDKVSYINDDKINEDYSIGVMFEEYYIDGDKFKSSGKQTKAYFPDVTNVYQFILHKDNVKL
jgi:hypothetical protein